MLNIKKRFKKMKLINIINIILKILGEYMIRCMIWRREIKDMKWDEKCIVIYKKLKLNILNILFKIFILIQKIKSFKSGTRH